jgi:hypothetical protein
MTPAIVITALAVFLCGASLGILAVLVPQSAATTTPRTSPATLTPAAKATLRPVAAAYLLWLTSGQRAGGPTVLAGGR